MGAGCLPSFARAVFESRTMEEVNAYVSRGRRFGNASEDEIAEAWVAAFDLALGRGDKSRRADLEDLFAEFHLRGLELPVHRVRSTMDALAEHMRRRPDIVKNAARTMLDRLQKSLMTSKN